MKDFEKRHIRNEETMTENTQNLPEIPLNDADRQKISALAQSIDPADTSLVLYYGGSVQRKLAAVSDKRLAVTVEKSAFGIADAINALVDEIREGFETLTPLYRYLREIPEIDSL